MAGSSLFTEEEYFVRKLFSKEKLILKIRNNNPSFDPQTIKINLNFDEATKEFFDEKFLKKYGCYLFK